MSSAVLRLGALAGITKRQAVISTDARLFLFTGLVGGFATFSAFGAEGVNLIRREDFGVAFAYAALSLVCGFAAMWIGMKLCGVQLRHG
jgi:CrcB protein